jgi:hypothetical protein
MRVSWFVAVATFSTAVSSQGFSDQIPQCAVRALHRVSLNIQILNKSQQACFSNNLGSCAVNDVACICGNTAVINKVSCCIFATCPQSDIAGLFTTAPDHVSAHQYTATTQLAAQLCKLQNVEVNTAPSCVSGSATPPASNSTASVTASYTPTTSAISTGAAALHTAGTGLGFGLAIAGWLMAL